MYRGIRRLLERQTSWIRALNRARTGPYKVWNTVWTTGHLYTGTELATFELATGLNHNDCLQKKANLCLRRMTERIE